MFDRLRHFLLVIEHGTFTDDTRPTWILESLSLDETERSAAT